MHSHMTKKLNYGTMQKGEKYFNKFTKLSRQITILVAADDASHLCNTHADEKLQPSHQSAKRPLQRQVSHHCAEEYNKNYTQKWIQDI